MKKIILVTLALMSINTFAVGRTYNSDGTSSYNDGHRTWNSDGSTSYTDGHRTWNSDGTSTYES